MTTRLHATLLIAAAMLAGALTVQGLADVRTALADDVAVVDAGAAAKSLETGAPVPPAVEPQPKVHNPVTHPGEAFDEVRAARKLGWPALVIVGLTMVLLALGSIFPTRLGPLARGSLAFVMSCATAACLAAGNAVMSGGAWGAVGTAAVLAAFGVWKADRDAAARERDIKAARPA